MGNWEIGKLGIEKTDLLGLSPEGLKDFVEKIGQKSYRARQLRSWIFEKASAISRA